MTEKVSYVVRMTRELSLILIDPITSAVDSFSSNSKLHPAILRLGLQISEGRIAGSTETCVEMLRAFKVG